MISHIILYGGGFFFHFMSVFQGLVFLAEWVTSNTSENRRPMIDHFDSHVWRLVLLFPRSPIWPSSLLNMVVIHSMMYLYCALCVLSLCSLRFLLLWFQVRLWSISTNLLWDQELSSAWWYLMFLNIKVFLRNLFFSSSISLSNSLVVSNCLLFSHFIFSFQTSNSLSHHYYC